MKPLHVKALAALLFTSLGINASAQKEMEYLNRGIIALHHSADSVMISWRVTAGDPADVGFNLYRQTGSAKPVKLNGSVMSGATFFSDVKPDFTQQLTYTVKPVVNGKEGKESEPFVLKANSEVRSYLSIPLSTPEGYIPNDASVGDLDGDGQYEIVLHQASRGRDNSQAGITGLPILQAYKLDGTKMWEINLGRNIREGAHYTQFMVYDFDGDGKAEVACKTADGTIDGKGKVIGDSSKDYRTPAKKNERTGQMEGGGYILSGPEYLTMFNGETGAAMNTTDFIPARYPDNLFPTTKQLADMWGDGYGNRMDRFLAAVAYLDGKHPSLIMSRGYYTRTFITAWDWKGGKLVKRWAFDSQDRQNPYSGQGNHNLSVTDVDNDGKDEIIFGAMTIDDNGQGLYSTGIGHADALHVSDLDPDRPGLEVFDTQERFSDAGANFRDARTGEIIWKKASVQAGADKEGPGRALSLNIDPRYRGFESWVAGASLTDMWDVKGNKIASRTPPCNMGIFWDGDLLSEILNGADILKWDYLNERTIPLFTGKANNVASNNGTKANPCLSADILGDWREELIVRSADNKELRIYSTTIPTSHRFVTFMHDPQYRVSIAWQNVAYNQPPHTSFYIGDDMAQPPKPDITIVKPKR
jgi:rhamnogalacturonan endolyase